MSQKADIIEYLKKHGSITPRRAMLDLGIYRLAARIYDLEDEGFVIPRETIEVLLRGGKKTRVTKYLKATVWP